MPKTYSIYETKSKLSEILRVVKSGSKIIISERGKPIAEISPYIASDIFIDRLDYLTNHGNLIKATAKHGFRLEKPIDGALDRFLEERE